MQMMYSWAQGTSNKGTDFWFVYAPHVNGYSDGLQKMSIYITSDVNTSGKLEIPGIGHEQEFSVIANQVTIVNIPQGAYSGGAEGRNNKGIHLTSLKPIVAYGHIYNSSMSGATLLLPTNTLGKDYYSINFTQKANSENAYSFCLVVATEDNTQIIIKPSVNTLGGLSANTEHVITLNKGEVYQIFGKQTSEVKNNAGSVTMTTGDDLTGTTIRSVAANGQSCKRIAVFSGSTRVSIGCSTATAPGSADNLFQQVYPTSTWGKSFVTVPSKNRNYDIYRVFKSSPTAVVKLNGVIIPSTNFVGNLYYEFASQQTSYIESDNTIQVVQYQVTQNKQIASTNCRSTTGDVGDPEMIFLNPLEQTLNKMTMYSSPFFNILRHYINVVIRTADVNSFTLDGTSQALAFNVVPNKAGYSYAQIEVTAGPHTLQAGGGFNATAYGFGNAESYGYAAGASLISPGIEVNDETTNLPKEQGCIGEGYNLFVSLPYQPLSVVVNFDDGLGDKTAILTAPTTFVSNDITYYKYKLFSNILFTAARKYLIKLSAEKPATDGCGAVDLLELEYEVLRDPEASFQILSENVCNGVATTFTDQSQAFGNNVVKWHWDYGDGQTEVKTSGAPFVRTYPPGVYPVKLFVENEAGCLSEVFTKNITVRQLPVADFNVSTVQCEQNTVSFLDKSTSVDGAIVAWKWEFGDGATSEIANPAHVYTVARSYDVKLTIVTAYGCEKSFTKTITINPLPIAEFDLPDFCLADANAVFINNSTVPTGEQLTYLWDFGDAFANAQRPNTSTQRNGSHAYTKTGIYVVTLTVKSLSGCVATVQKEFTVNGSIPNAAFDIVNANNLCSNTSVTFRDLATVDFGEVTKIEWFFDYDNRTTADLVDEQPNLRNASAKIYTYQYPTFSNAISKTYKVKMKAYSGNSCVSEETKSITIYPAAIPNFSLVTGCLTDGQASFENLTTYIDNNAPLTYRWNFGDDLATPANPNTSTSKSPFHNYTRAGKYNVSLTVTTPFGCETTIVKEVTIEGAIPIANFEVKQPNLLCSQTQVTFEDKTTLAFGEVTRIDWYYDFANNPNQVETDLSPGTGPIARTYSHLYPLFNIPFTKNYVVRMVAYSGNTCIATVEKTITINAQPTVEFIQPNPICQEVPTTTFLATEKNGMPGTGVFSGKGVNKDGVFVPSQAGVGEHVIKYIFTSAAGCAVEVSRTVMVNETPSIDAGEDKTVLEGGQASLTATALGNGLTFKWSPSTGLDRDDILNPIARPTEDMIYTLTATSANGCSASDVVKVKYLKNLVVPSAFTPNGDGINDIWNIHYIDNYPEAVVEVYDRAGQRVFFSQGYKHPFDGNAHGKEMPVGVYYYIIKINPTKKPLTGSLTIIR